MGHLVNPLLYRLNYSAFWNGSLISSNKFDNYINLFSVYFSNFVRGYFKNYNWVDKNYLFVISLKFFFLNKSIFVYIDFWQNGMIKKKYAALTETIYYLFTLSLKKHCLKIEKYSSSKRTFNYYAWKKFFVYEQGLFTVKLKLKYRTFYKKFLNIKSRFNDRTPLKVKFFKYNDDDSWVNTKYSEKFNFFNSSVKTYLFDHEIDALAEIEMRNINKVIYSPDLFNVYSEYCAQFSYNSPCLEDAYEFFVFSNIQPLPKVISRYYWRDFNKYLYELRGGVILDNFWSLFTFILYYSFDEICISIKLEIELEKKRKEELEDLRILEIWQKPRLGLKYLKHHFKFIKFKSNFLNFSDVSILKKKKLKSYFFVAKTIHYKFRKFVRYNRYFFNKASMFDYFNSKKMFSKKKINFINSPKITWWKNFAYSLIDSKKILIKNKYVFNRAFYLLKNKVSFFKQFKFKVLKRFSKKKRTFVFKFSSKKFKLKKKVAVIRARRIERPRKFRKFPHSKLRLGSRLKSEFAVTLKLKSKRVNSQHLVSKLRYKKKNYVAKLFNFLKKKNNISKIKFNFDVKNVKLWKKKIFKKPILFLKKRDPFSFTKAPLLRKIYFFNKTYFFNKKMYSRRLWMRISRNRRIRSEEEDKHKEDIASGLIEDEEAEEAEEKKEDKYFDWFFSKWEDNAINNKDGWLLYFDGVETTLNGEKRPVPFWKNKYVHESTAMPKSKIFTYLNKTFVFILNNFFFLSKIYSLKKNFLTHVNLLTSFFVKIKVFFLIRSQFNFVVTADLVGEFLVLWFMKKKFTIKEILGTLLNYLKKCYYSKIIGGYGILMKGRFTRKDRAMYSWKKLGAMPLSTRISTIEYSNRWVPLKYSQCAFKVYILKFDSSYIRKKHINVRKKDEIREYINAYAPK